MTEVETDREDADERAYQTIGAAALSELAQAGLCVQTVQFMGLVEPVVERAKEVMERYRDSGEPDAYGVNIMEDAVDALEGRD
jgi:hypothetical protein